MPARPLLRLATIALALLAAAVLAGAAVAAPLPEAALAGDRSAAAARAAHDLRAPLAFEANAGQADPAVRFLARGAGYALLLAPAEILLALRAEPASPARVQMRFVGGSPAPALAGLEPLASRSHYLIGNDPARWRTGVPRFARVAYRGVYPGVDAVFYGNQRQIEYDLVLAPGADPAAIVIGFRGAERVAIDDGGALVLHTAGGDLRQRAPLVYQEVGGRRRRIDGAFVRLGRRGGEERLGFRVAAWDRTRPLVIDPILSYATYLGGHPDNDGRAVAIDDEGNAYVTGHTLSATFPTVGGLPDPHDMLGGFQDAFVAKYGPTGTLVYATYLGGGGSEIGHAIAADADGNAYVTGQTQSSDFPTVGPLPPPYDALQGSQDAFVTKLDPEGDAIVYSTFLGGTASASEMGSGIAVDATHNAYVTGTVFSDDFPIAGALMNNVLHGGTDVFVSKFAANGASLAYSIYLGGTGFEKGLAVAVRNGEAYVTGQTQSMDFPTVSGLPAPNDGLRGFEDGFVTKLNAAGDGIVYSTYLSGSSDVDHANAIAVDGDGNAFVGGKTQSSNFLHAMAMAGSLPAPNDAFRGGADGFVVKLGAAGNTLGFLAFLGGSFAGDDEEVNGIGLDADRNVYVTGQTDANDFPVLNGLPLQNRLGGNNNGAIVTKIAAAGDALLYSTFLGGTASEVGRGIAVDALGTAHVVGQTLSSDFPTVNAAQPVRGSGEFSGGDAFVAKILPGQPAGFAYTVGNVFVSAPGFGEVRELTPDGTLVRGLPVPSGGFAQGTSLAGSAFDAAGNLYVADAIQNAVFRFGANGTFDETFASGINAAPQALVFDQVGNLLVSTTLGDNDVRKYDPAGTLLDQYDVFIHSQGRQWIDLAADQRSLFFTSGVEDVAVFDLATDTQLDDFFLHTLITAGLRLLPGGAALVADGTVVRVNASGNVNKTYLESAGDVFAVSRDPDGTSFWAAGAGFSADGIVYRVDIASEMVLEQFTGAEPVGILGPAAIGGLSVFGELTEAGDGAPAATPTGPTPTPTPTITPTQTPAPEVCDDCFDNDFDGDLDRDDADCPARADGTGMGFDDPKGLGKAITKCSKTLGKAGAKFEAAKLKGLHKCLLAVLACVQQKPGDAACLGKSAGKCSKALAKLPNDRGKLATAIGKACATATLDPSDLLIAIGLGYGSESAGCAAHGVGTLMSAADIASCVAAEHECRVEDLAGAETPRAAELLALAGLDPGDFPCLGAGADGGGDALDASRTKLAVKCAQAIAKAGAKFVTAKLKLAQKCAGAVYDCVQKKPGDAKCPPKAEKTCAKQLAKLTAPGKGAAAKLAAAIAKGCTKAPLMLTDLLVEDGLGFGALGGECAALGVPVIASIADLSTCLERRHECRVEQMLETQMPRLEELLAAGGIALP